MEYLIAAITATAVFLMWVGGVGLMLETHREASGQLTAEEVEARLNR